eukprot:6176225-Pleurochrysis_carterae.AAC.2
MADLLSIEREVGHVDGRPRSANSDRRYSASSFVISEAAMILASHEDRATDGCFFEFHDTAA